MHRMDESIVAFQLLLGMDTKDVLYLSSKTSGSYYYLKSGRDHSCRINEKAVITPEIKTYLSRAEWFAQNYGDYLLIEAVNQSLDLTIAALGHDRFDEALKKFQTMKLHAEEQCASAAVFPCSSDGKLQLEESQKNCYSLDEGCGYPCLDGLFF
mmetsp:Transcript_3051/g.4009  ORF Transcript_3051/g.4009 Transcript_3051/m.4009 type:complete len:154 (+) Transcript_3051:3-464(+)